MGISSYRDLIAWQKAMDFVVGCYQAAEQFPRTEQFGLCSQLQRAAVSIPANIAEGQGREHTREFINHLSIARGSLCEAETHILIAERLGYLKPESVQPLLSMSEEIARITYGLIAALERRLNADKS